MRVSKFDRRICRFLLDGTHPWGRPAELRGDLAGAAVEVEHPLDRVPLVPREPPVRPPGRLLLALL